MYMHDVQTLLANTYSVLHSGDKFKIKMLIRHLQSMSFHMYMYMYMYMYV